MSRERIADLQGQIVMGKFDNGVTCTAQRYVEGGVVDPIPPEILEGVAHASIEEQRLTMLRLRDRISPFVPAHSLLRSGHAGPSVSYAAPTNANFAADVGVTVAEAIASHFAAKSKVWRPKTLAARKWQLGGVDELVDAGSSG